MSSKTSLPNYTKCDICEGKQKINVDGMIRDCVKCQGLGIMKVSDNKFKKPSSYNSGSLWVKCKSCDGIGERFRDNGYGDVPCYDCNETGYVLKTK